MQISDWLTELLRERGPLTVAAFMDLALYHPEFGYYARGAQRSGRAGDFFTSVDVGPLFGELLEIQLAEMAEWLRQSSVAGHQSPVTSRQPPFDLVEAGAGNGRLSADILRAARRGDPAFYDAMRLHLVEVSAEARDAQRNTLGDVADRLVSSSASLPESFEGALVANELVDAFPVHQVVMREDGLREVYVTTSHHHAITTCEGPPSTPALQEYLDRLGVTLEPGWRVEINLRAVDWVRDAARRLRRGFLILIDYGHDARDLYSVTHASGTLTTFSGHRSAGPESSVDAPAWLRHPGGQDLTAHVDFTSVRAAAEAEGATTIGFLDQTYFLLGLLKRGRGSFPEPGAFEKDPRPLKTLVMPGGLGSTHKVLILGKNVGTPALRGCSFSMRVT
ncbi:MAG: SAM-dependent methyltransferase [Acidobacteria bacterium]|nr:SAM-dependent methyltransferase [Acidobacteriota bacterium]